ncbi:MAG TPA: NAD(P)H-hydrate dehydratase [Longimicrobiales bacterium]|nr:NAD(P)H-hydrate dehydratase [Longimicrobiales bacterium]
MTAPAVYGRERVALVTAAEAAELDRHAQADAGVPGRVLMESAGRAAAEVIHRLYPAGRIVAFVGGGNNGGDALVALRSLAAWGREVAWIPAAGSAPDPALLAGTDLPPLSDDDLDTALADPAVLVDGVLGTGARGAPRERAAALIRRMNGSERPIVALDIPSGVDPTTGEVPGEAVTAAVTVMFGWPKRGGLLQPGRSRCGRILAVEIGFPPLPEDGAAAALITPGWARARLPGRDPDAHKNSVGRVLVVAGRKGMAGAAAIAGRSAVRAGAGLVRVVSDDANRGIIQSLVPEGLFIDRADNGAVAEALEASDALLAGPAMGTGRAEGTLLDRLLDGLGERRCVLDADALTILAARDGMRDLDGRFVLTPHPGEMSRITGLSVGDIRHDPLGRAAELAAGTAGAVVLLKGSPSVVAAAGAPVLVNSVGSSDLAAAAMGDQLAGMIAAFLAAGALPRDAAALGLFYGGRAAELARRGRGLTPDDVTEHLPAAFDHPGPDRPPLDLPFILFDQPARW